MNIKDLLSQEKSVSKVALFRSRQAAAAVIQILQGEQMNEHVTKVPALLLCIIGKVVFENEKGVKETLQSGDYLQIEPMIKHWINAMTNSQLILFK